MQLQAVTITLSNGAKISLPENGIVKESDGLPYTSSINVYAAYIDPTATNINETVPGFICIAK